MQLKSLANIHSILFDIDNLKNTTKSMKALNDIGKSYTTETLKSAIAQSDLNKQQIKTILSANGLKGELLKTTTAELENAISINMVDKAQKKTWLSTVGLGKAFKGLWITLKSNPLLLFATIGTTVISIFSRLKQSAEEARQAAQDAAKEYKETAESVDDYIKKYNELRNALIKAKGNDEETYNIKKQLYDLQSELNEKFGDEYNKINLVTDAYKDQTDAIKKFNKESANQFLNEHRNEIQNAKNVMESEDTYKLSMPLSDKGDKKKVLDIARKYEEEGKGVYLKGVSTLLDDGEKINTYTIYIKADPQTAYDTINSFATDVKDLSNELGKEDLFDGMVMDDTTSALIEAKGKLDKYEEIYEQSQIANIAIDKNLSTDYNEAVSAVEKYNEAVLRSSDAYSDDNVKAAWEEMQKIKQKMLDDENWTQYSNILNNVFSSADDKAYEFYNLLQNDFSLKGLLNELQGLSEIDLKSMFDDGTEGENYDAFDRLYEKAQKYGLELKDIIELLIRLGIIHGSLPKDGDEKTMTIIRKLLTRLGT